MPRSPRKLVEGGAYWISNRVASGEEVFVDSEEARRFLDLLGVTKVRDDWMVYAWVLLPDRFHLVVGTSAAPLSRGMHSLQNAFSRGFNSRAGRSGSLWHNRYRAELVESEASLPHFVVWVHLGPVRAGLVEDPAHHLLGGHREIHRRVRAPIVDVGETLSFFGTDAKTGRRTYLSAIRKERKTITRGGSRAAKSTAAPEWTGSSVRRSDGRPETPVPRGTASGRRASMEAGEFVRRLCALLEVAPEKLSSRLRDSATAEARRTLVTLGVERWGQTSGRLARVLGKNPNVVSWWVGEGIRRRLKDPDFALRLEGLDRKMESLAAREDLG